MKILNNFKYNNMHNTFERILTFVLFVCMLSGIHVVAQVRTLHGHVIDATFDEPLIGVTVRIDELEMVLSQILMVILLLLLKMEIM